MRITREIPWEFYVLYITTESLSLLILVSLQILMYLYMVSFECFLQITSRAENIVVLKTLCLNTYLYICMGIWCTNEWIVAGLEVYKLVCICCAYLSV